MIQFSNYYLTFHESANPYYCYFMADGLDSQVDVSSRSDQPDLCSLVFLHRPEHEESSRTHDQ